MIVDINKFEEMLQYIEEINSVPFNELRFEHNGNVFKAPDDLDEVVKYSGLSNKTLIEILLDEWRKYQFTLNKN